MQGAHFYLLCGLFGVCTHTLLRYRSLSTDARKANTELSFRKFLCLDWTMIMVSFFAVAAWYLLFEEAVAKYPGLSGFVRTSFFLIGFFGSYILQQIESPAKRLIRKIIDVKTDKADGVEKDNSSSTSQ